MAKNILNSIFNTQSHLSQDELNAYLNNRAPSDVRHKVENTMLDDPLYADAVEGFQEMHLHALPALESFSEFKKKLPLEEETKVVQLTPVRNALRILAAVAAVLLLVAGYFFLQDPSPDQLFTEYYTPYENDISLARRGDTEGMQPDFKNALGNYAVRNFDTAIADFEKAIRAEPGNDAAHFFAGLALIEKGREQDAIYHLDLVKNNQGVYSRKAYWYAILARLKSGDMEVAKNMLIEFSAAPGYKSNEAKLLLEEM